MILRSLACLTLMLALYSLPCGAQGGADCPSILNTETCELFWNGGSTTVAVQGTFSGATAVVTWSGNYGNAVKMATACEDIIVDGFCSLSVGNGKIFVDVTGGDGATDLIVNFSVKFSSGGGADGAGAGLLSITEESPDTIYASLVSGGALRFRDNGEPSSNDTLFRPAAANMVIEPLNGDLFFHNAQGLVFRTATVSGVEQILLAPFIQLRSVSTASDPTLSHSDVTGIGLSATVINQIVGTATSVTTTAVSHSVADGLTLELPESSAIPFACAGGFEGHVYWDSNQLLMCRCNGTAWEGFNVGGGGAVLCT